MPIRSANRLRQQFPQPLRCSCGTGITASGIHTPIALDAQHTPLCKPCGRKLVPEYAKLLDAFQVTRALYADLLAQGVMDLETVRELFAQWDGDLD
jgi:hypothetical protein